MERKKDKPKKNRLDLLLVEKGLCESREQARKMTMAGLVLVNRQQAFKPAQSVSIDSEILLKEPHPPYVSRGGLKLEAALKHFRINPTGKVFLDVGASTGGFTDCLLQHGAGRVIAVDVGYGQFHWKLRNDPRVRIMERTNIRYLTPEALGETAHGAVIDVSFISLEQVVPTVGSFLVSEGDMIALIKPQFEVGREQVGKGGVVRDPDLHRDVIARLSRFFEKEGWQIQGRIPSPLLGPKGNREFLMHLVRERPA